MIPTLVLFAHGSRDPAWAEPLRRVQALVAARPDAPPVRLAFLEFMAPDLARSIADAVADGAQAVRIAPFFLGQGGHLRRDLAMLVEAARAAHPHLAIEVLPAAGESDAVARALAEWAVTAAGLPAVKHD